MARVLHAGLHKTGSSFLQRQFFPKLENTLFIQKLDLAKVRNLSDRDKSILFSNEAACGYPYPLAEEFSIARIKSNLEIIQCEKIILVEREFNSWVLSLYFQTLNENFSWSLEQFILENRDKLLTWKGAPKAIAQMCQERGIELLVIKYGDLYRNVETTLQRISAFIDGSTFDPSSIRHQERINISRYGTSTIYVYRKLNLVMGSRLGRGLKRVIGRTRRLPRRLIQGRLGSALDRLSARQLSVADVDRLMQ